MKPKTKIAKKMIILFLLLTALTAFIIWQNNSVVITNYIYTNSKLPQSFDGYKIVHISDLHNKDYRGKLPPKINQLTPDIIVITGDLIDRRNTQVDTAVEFVRQIAVSAPLYYVSGNHEQLSGAYEELKQELKKLNVQNLDNSYVLLKKGKDEIGLMGIADPAVQQDESTYLWTDSSVYIENGIRELLNKKETNFNILLCHRPEYFGTYTDTGVDLVFSGHAHGGQIRIPLIGGLVAPNQGWFPKYTEGVYHEGKTSMVVSRGLGNSIFPIRVFNRPELVVVTLKKQ